MPGTLFVVATPIGNLEDLSFRALRTLREVDLIAAEDTRRTSKLLAHYEIRKSMVSLHEHNEHREAPRLADYRSVSFWQKPSLLTAWNVTGQPVLQLPNGFGRSGLPLGMQIVGRPFGETTILRVGQAYERATEWHTRRPQLVRGAAAPDVTPPPVLSGGADSVDAETRDLCVKAARRAGLPLDDLMLAQLLEGAPYALAMVQRLRRDHDVHHEPANVFSFPPTAGSR